MKQKKIISLFILILSFYSIIAVAENIKSSKAYVKNLQFYNLPDSVKTSGAIVKLKAIVKPDSSVMGLSVVEDKFNLKHIALEKAKSFVYVPAFNNGAAVQSLLLFDVSFVKKELIEEIESEESEENSFSIEKLKEEVMTFNDDFNNKQKLKDIGYIYSVNNHSFALPYAKNMFFRRNFYVFSNPLSNSQKEQYFSSFDKVSQNNKVYAFTKTEYDFPVMFSSATLTSGSYDMKNADVSIFQGSLFKIPNLNLNAFFASQDGRWPEANQKASDINLDLEYRNNYGKVSLFYTKLNHDFSNHTLKPAYASSSPDVITLNSSEGGFKYQKNGFGIAYKKLNEEYKNVLNNTVKRNQKQYLLDVDKKLWHNELYFSYTYLQDKNNVYSVKQKGYFKHLFNFKHSFKKYGIDFNQQLLNGAEQKLYYSSNISYNIFKYFGLGLAGDYTKYDTSFNKVLANNQRVGILIKSKVKNNKLSLVAGQLKQNGNNFYAELNKTTKNEFYNFTLKTTTNAVFVDNDKLVYTPKNQVKMLAKLSYDLGHENTLFGGLNIINSGKCLDENNKNVPENTILNASLGFTITRKFELKVSFINITDEYTAFNQTILPRHVNFGIRWNFIN